MQLVERLLLKVSNERVHLGLALAPPITGERGWLGYVAGIVAFCFPRELARENWKLVVLSQTADDVLDGAIVNSPTPVFLWPRIHYLDDVLDADRPLARCVQEQR